VYRQILINTTSPIGKRGKKTRAGWEKCVKEGKVRTGLNKKKKKKKKKKEK